MKAVFVTNRLTHHQVPFCTNLKMAGVLERIILCKAIDAGKEHLYPDYDLFQNVLVEAYMTDKEKDFAYSQINEADVVIAGSASETMLRERIRSGKLLFRYSERPLKDGLEPLKYLPRLLRWHWRNPMSKPIYMLCASAFTAADYAKFGLFRDRCYKWGYFPEAKKYNTDELFERKQNDVPQLLWCGRFLDLKHPDDAICVAERLKKAGYRFVLNFIGKGELQPRLEQMIAEKNLGDCVHLLGAMKPEQVRQHMEWANIYLFTSDRQEGWGAVLNESMNSGCAVVASHAIGSVPFLVKDGENGLIYKSGNVDMLYEKVKYLLDTPAEQRRLGEAAYRTILEEWNAEVAAKRLIELSEHLLRGEKFPDLFETGPCSRANVLKGLFRKKGLNL